MPIDKWNSISEDYFEKVLTPFSNSFSTKLFFSKFTIEETIARVLDAGCGNGYFLKELISRYPHLTKPAAIDFSDKMLENARKRIGSCVQLICSKMEYLPFAGNSFDYIFAINSLIADDRSVREWSFKELNRVLNSSGKLILLLPSLESYWEQLHVARENFISDGMDEKQAVWEVYDTINKRLFDPIGGYVNVENSALRIKLYTRWEIRKNIEAAGFSNVMIDRYQYSYEHCTKHNLICSNEGLFDWFVIAQK
ncbi:MAG: class I SAM-dependent methyltransferase [Chitinispirillaceae bacterium]|nr:class I SAM-dependent methyltransferase [Chitinispirillaceae bacterium]